MDDVKIFECVTSVGCIRCRKDNDTILKYAIITKLGELFEKSLYTVSFNNEFIPILNTYIIDDLAFLVIILEKEHYSSK